MYFYFYFVPFEIQRKVKAPDTIYDILSTIFQFAFSHEQR